MLRLIRFIVAYVFITSGLMKFLSIELSDYFISLGFPYPVYFKNMIALIEIVCGILIFLNKRVKYSTIPLIAIMIGALLTTKVPLLQTSFMNFIFQARLDIVMLALLVMLYQNYHRNY